MTKSINGIDGNKLQINEFILNDIADNATILMIAKRGCGKSWICRELMTNFRKMPVGVVIAPTDKMNKFYKTFFPDTFIHYKYSSSLIDKILYRQKKIIEKTEKNDKIKPDIFINMDDCLADKKTWVNDFGINEILLNGRHHKITFMLTIQDPMGIPPIFRNNFEYIFLLKNEIHSDLKKIYEHYAGIFPTYHSFQQIHSQLTKDHGCMVIVNTDRHKKSLDESSFLGKVFWFKARNLDNIKHLGCSQFQKFHEKNYDINWEKKEGRVDITQYCINKKKTNDVIVIEKVKNE